MAELVIVSIVSEDDENKFLGDDNDDDVVIFAAVSSFMRRELNRSFGFYEVTIPTYFGDEFRSHFRLTRQTAEALTREVVATGKINTGNGFGRAPIPPHKQTLIYLWVMANGRETARQVADKFNITMSSCARVLRRVNAAVVSLRPRYIKWPNDNEMRDIVDDFETQGFPGVIGVVDGTFIAVKAPSVDPESYNCRKKFHALQLQVVCDNNMVFTDVLAGWPGSVHDSRILRNSSLYSTAANKFARDYHILGDGGYPLLSWLMTPFRNNGHLQPNQIHFNDVLKSCRQIVERAISLLKGRWRKLLYLDHSSVKLMVQLIMGACVLHNFCLINDDFDESYFLDDDTDDDDDDDDGNNGGPNAACNTAEQKRNHLVNLV